MTTAMDFLEPQLCRRRCDHSNDLENPLLEATSGTTEGDYKQESSKEDPSTPRPKWLMLALVFQALFMKTMATTIFIQLSSQGPNSISLSYVWGVIVLAIVDVILVGVIFLVLADHFRLVVKDQGFFGKICMMMAGILIGLAFFATTCLLDVVVNFQLTVLIEYYFQLTFLIGYYCFTIGLGAKRDSQTIYLHWSRFQSCLGFSVGLTLGVFMSMILPVANLGLQGGLTAPNLVSVLLASLLELTSFLAFTAVSIIWNPEEANYGVEDEENCTLL
jgi:hypothetical protein